MATKDVYIHGNNGKISWVEDSSTSSNLCSDPCQWDVTVRFHQHAASAQDVYCCANGSDLTFTLDKTEGDEPLSSRTYELTPPSGQEVVLQPKDNSSQQGTQQGQRWYGGYVQKS